MGERGGEWDELCWRRERDSNPRWDFVPYSLSRGAPSAARPPLRESLVLRPRILALFGGKCKFCPEGEFSPISRRRRCPCPLSFPSSAWECVAAKLCFASLTPLPIPDSFRRLRFAKQSLAGRIPKQSLGTTGGAALGNDRGQFPCFRGGGSFRSGVQPPTGSRHDGENGGANRPAKRAAGFAGVYHKRAGDSPLNSEQGCVNNSCCNARRTDVGGTVFRSIPCRLPNLQASCQSRLSH